MRRTSLASRVRAASSTSYYSSTALGKMTQSLRCSGSSGGGGGRDNSGFRSYAGGGGGGRGPRQRRSSTGSGFSSMGADKDYSHLFSYSSNQDLFESQLQRGRSASNTSKPSSANSRLPDFNLTVETQLLMARTEQLCGKYASSQQEWAI